MYNKIKHKSRYIDYIWYIILFLIFLSFDRITKYYFFFIKDVFKSNRFYLLEIEPTLNYGLIFGLFGNHSEKIILFMKLFTIPLFGAIFTSIYIKRKLNYFILPEILVIIGGMSNLFDRFWYGGVLDFLSISTIFFYTLPIGNIADIYIIIGLIFMFFDWNKHAEEYFDFFQ